MTPREIVLEQIRHRSTSTIPYTLSFEGDVPDRLDAHYGDTSWRDRLTPYITSCGGVATMKREALGQGYERDMYGSLWRVDQRPFHLEEPGLKQPSFEGYDFPEPEAFVAPDFASTASQALETNRDSFTTLGLGWGLWENCWGIRGFENALIDCHSEPDFLVELLDRLTDLFLAHVARFADIAADAVMCGDDWGDQRGVMVGPERWRQYFKPRYARIYEAIHAQGKLVISHCCGSVAEIMPDIIEIGLDVLESVQPEAEGMNPYELKKQWGDKITFWGGLGSQSTIPFGTPADIRGEVKRLCAEMGDGGGYILAPAKGLQPETPTENAVAVLEAFTDQG